MGGIINLDNYRYTEIVRYYEFSDDGWHICEGEWRKENRYFHFLSWGENTKK